MTKSLRHARRPGKDLTRTDERVLRSKIEAFYLNKIRLYNYLTDGTVHASLPKTKIDELDRQYRLILRSCEIILASVGSDLIPKDAKPNYRNTKTVSGIAYRHL